MNKDKLVLISLDHDGDRMREIVALFGEHFITLEEGCKYLGFFLKLNGYVNNDWTWLI